MSEISDDVQRQRMEAMARWLDAQFNPDGQQYGFAMVVFKLDDPNHHNYVSNCNPDLAEKVFKRQVNRFRERTRVV